MKVSAIEFAVVAAVLPYKAKETPAAHPDRLSVEITVSPAERFFDPASGPRPDFLFAKPHFLVTAVVRQLETGKVIFAPKIYALAGTLASVSGEREDGTRLKASFTVDSSSARYTIEVTRGKDQTSLNSGTVQLSKE